jgi:hypothetical protein
MTEEPADEFFEYECPLQGIDFDIRPIPIYGSKIKCSACDREHVADETLGVPYREDPDGPGGFVEIQIDEWKRKSASA